MIVHYTVTAKVKTMILTGMSDFQLREIIRTEKELPAHFLSRFEASFQKMVLHLCAFSGDKNHSFGGKKEDAVLSRKSVLTCRTFFGK